MVGTNLYLVMNESLLQLLKPNFGRNRFYQGTHCNVAIMGLCAVIFILFKSVCLFLEDHPYHFTDYEITFRNDPKLMYVIT